MKKYLACPTLLVLVTLSVFSQEKLPSADEVFQKTIDKLNSLKTVSYNHRGELNYASEKYFHERNATVYLDFASLDKTIGVNFQFVDGNWMSTFNGTEYFSRNTKTKIIRINNKKLRYEFEVSPYLGNSPVSLKINLPKILADPTISRSVSETKIDGKDFYLIEYVLDKFYMDLFGDFSKQKLSRKITYRITVSKDNFMPVEILQKNGDVDFIKTNFTNIVEQPAPPAEATWYYSTYLNEYKFEEPPKDKLIQVGAYSRDLSLTSFSKEPTTTTLRDLRGSVVMLQFWIFHCGYCQSAVPALNEIQEKYRYKKFRLLAVNVYDSPELLNLFIEREKPVYQIIQKGEDAANEYGVDRYPTIVLLDKNNIVIYSGGLDPAKITALIDKNL